MSRSPHPDHVQKFPQQVKVQFDEAVVAWSCPSLVALVEVCLAADDDARRCRPKVVMQYAGSSKFQIVDIIVHAWGIGVAAPRLTCPYAFKISQHFMILRVVMNRRVAGMIYQVELPHVFDDVACLHESSRR